MNKPIYLSLAHMSGAEQTFIEEAFRTNWVAPLGPNVNGFEADLENYLSAEARVCALSAGTAALHLGLIQLDVHPGDEVICQSFTFSASANPICYQGATPVFVDSETDTWNLDPVRLEEAIKDRIAQTGRKPKAIIPVHLYGMPARMQEICDIANRYEIPILEDAAEALGSTYHGKPCGTFGHFGALSFNGNKIITTSGGGALVCNNAEEKKHTLFLATQARDEAPHYQHSNVGYNYRMSNICAGIGRGQMTVLDEHLAARRRNNALYRKALANVPGISFQSEPDDSYRSNFWLTTILVDPEKTGDVTRDVLRLALEAENIESRPLWKPLHLQPIFADAPRYGGEVCEKMFNQGLCLPSGPMVSESDLHRICELLLSYLPHE